MPTKALRQRICTFVHLLLIYQIYSEKLRITLDSHLIDIYEDNARYFVLCCIVLLPFICSFVTCYIDILQFQIK